MRTDLPYVAAGQSVGLFGGSFDPPHPGHVHLSHEALKRLGLDQVWWLVTPGNPLKAHGPARLERRIAAARRIVAHPDIRVTGIEARLGTRYTAQTLQALFRLYPRTRFVWLMGADNLAQFHLWQDWRWILDNVPVAVFARPGQPLSACTGKAPGVYAGSRLPPTRARALLSAGPPRWCYLNMPLVDISSSEIRARGEWT